MDERIATAKLEAEGRFLGKGHVVGVAIAQRAGQLLVFFLDDRSSDTERSIASWAQKHGISFEFRVVGTFRPLL